MILPSEVLNREFVFEASKAPAVSLVDEVSTVTTHSVLVGDIGLLLPSGEVSELVDHLPVCKLPNTPEWFSGVSSLRGNIIPVFNLHDFFEVRLPDARRRIIVVGSGDTAVAFWIDEMPRMVVLGLEDEMAGDPPLPDSIRKHAKRFYLKNNQIWVDWDVQKFFTFLGAAL